MNQKLLQRLILLRKYGPQWVALVSVLDNIIAKLETVEKMEGPKGEDGKTPIAGVDFPLPKDGKNGVDGRDGKDAENQIFVGKNPPPNPKKGDLWSKI